VDFSGLAVSPPIGEALAGRPLDRQRRAHRVVIAELNAVGIAEVELGEIAVKMRRRDVVIGAVDPALEDREEAFDRVGVSIAAHVFLGRVVHGLMAGELLADLPIDTACSCP